MKKKQTIEQKLNELQDLVVSQSLLKKDVLTFLEAVKYLDISTSYLYKFTSRSKIPHYKPQGKKIYFLRTDLDNYLLRHRVGARDEIEQKASTYVVLEDKKLRKQ